MITVLGNLVFGPDYIYLYHPGLYQTTFPNWSTDSIPNGYLSSGSVGSNQHTLAIRKIYSVSSCVSVYIVVLFFVLYVSFSYSLMIFYCMMFGEVVGIVCCASFPIHFKLLSPFSVAQPMVPHVPRFHSFHVNILMYKSSLLLNCLF